VDWWHLIQRPPDPYGGSRGRAFGKRVNGYDPDGELVFLVNGTLWMLTVPDTDDEGRPLIGCSAPTLACTALVDLIEVQAPKGGRSPQDLVDPEWARRYQAEQIWRARKR
jgi:hypothetical protein